VKVLGYEMKQFRLLGPENITLHATVNFILNLLITLANALFRA
jgi:hypothetical protein